MNNFSQIYEDTSSTEMRLGEIAPVVKIVAKNIDFFINDLMLTQFDIKNADTNLVKNIEILESKNNPIYSILTKTINGVKISKDKASGLLKKSVSKTFIAMEVAKFFIKEFGIKIDSKKLKVLCYKINDKLVLKISYGETNIEMYLNPDKEAIDSLLNHEE